MSADQLNYPDPLLGVVPIDAELSGGKRTPQHGVRDGSNIALGAMADAAASSDAGTFSLIALFKRLLGGWVAEDAAHASGDRGIMALSVRKDTAAATAGTDGDYQPLTTGSDGRLHVDVANNQVTVSTITISNGGSLSPATDLGTARMARIGMPASWTTAALTFQASYDNATWNDLYDASGNEYVVQAAASRAILLPVSDFYGLRYVKIRSGTTGTPVNQGADRDLKVTLVN